MQSRKGGSGHSLGRAESRPLTRLRQAVLDILEQTQEPLTAYALLESLQAQRPATPAGVYRSLDYLVAHGLAHRIASRKAFVACRAAAHPHITEFLMCRACGQVIEIASGPLAAMVNDQIVQSGFIVETGTLELSGLCHSCQT